MKISDHVRPQDLAGGVQRLFAAGSEKTLRLDRRWKTSDGAPVFTAAGKYAARGWTQWTHGFQYGNALFCFDITGQDDLLQVGLRHTLADMPEHLTHIGVHDHGFNTLSTYGQVYRFLQEGRIDPDPWKARYLELALRVSGAVQAARWTPLPEGLGYVYSFNGPQSLFIDTMRTIRSCAMAYLLGHTLLGEQDQAVNLLERLVTHARTTARYNIFYGTNRDGYDVPELRGRAVHETLFNVNNGSYRAPSSQQGFSPFTTWTRGLGWAMLGFSEELEFLTQLPDAEFGHGNIPTKSDVLATVESAARATCDFYIDQGTSVDGICYWDTGAPNLHRLGDWKQAPADPFNAFEPVDASASAIAAQGLLRLGTALGDAGKRYLQAGLTVAETLFKEPYLSTSSEHEGILLHSIYHHPNGWDYVPPGSPIPYGESSMWGDYHLLELGLLVNRMAEGRYYTFFDAALKGRNQSA